MNRLILVALAATVAVLLGCQGGGEADIAAAREEVRMVMDQINSAWETEDLDTFSRLIRHDPDMVSFGTDVNDRWVGWDGLERGLQQQFEVFSETKVTPRHIDIQVGSSGDVAWVAQAMNIKTNFLGSPVELECRITCVFTKQNENWSMVHFHYSVPISESRTLGM